MVSSPPLSRISVAEAVERYLRGVQRAVSGHSLAATTAQNYQRDLHEFIHLAGADTVLDDLTAEAVDDGGRLIVDGVPHDAGDVVHVRPADPPVSR